MAWIFLSAEKNVKNFFLKFFGGGGGGWVVGGLGATTQKSREHPYQWEQSGQDLDSPLKEVI